MNRSEVYVFDKKNPYRHELNKYSKPRSLKVQSTTGKILIVNILFTEPPYKISEPTFLNGGIFYQFVLPLCVTLFILFFFITSCSWN